MVEIQATNNIVFLIILSFKNVGASLANEEKNNNTRSLTK
jgi:hypothetical protein